MKKYNFGADEQEILQQNLLGIDNLEDLARAEQYAFMVRALEIAQGKFQIPSHDLPGLQALHSYLFQDVYVFAGQIRNVQLSKGTTRFCQAQFIDEMAQQIFHEMQQEPKWETLDEAAKRLAYFKAELNLLHPFREGNGRSIRIFIHDFAKSRGYEWQFEHLQQDSYLKAMIQSVLTSDELEQLFKDTLTKLTEG